MAVFTGTLVTTGIIDNLGTGVSLSSYVVAGANIGSTNNTAIFGNAAGQRVTVAGSVFSQIDSFHTIALLGDQASISVTATGMVFAATQLSTGAIATAGVSVISNAGHVEGGSGIVISGQSEIINTGTIIAHGRGGAQGSGLISAGIFIDGGPGVSFDLVQIYNSGTIIGAANGPSSDEPFEAFAVYERSSAEGDNVFIHNSGTMIGSVQLGFEADILRNTGVIEGRILMGAQGDRVENSGTITRSIDMGAGSDVVVNHGLLLAEVEFGTDGNDRLRNSGRIDADVFARGFVITVENDGTIQGGLHLSTLASTVQNSGRIVGGIFYGNGGDSYTGLSGSLVTGDIRGDDGKDTLTGAAQEERMFGGADDDGLTGRGGDDLLAGDGGADTLVGGLGDDTLIGGAGDDRMQGGVGADRLTGGTNADQMAGGEGADVFVFATPAEIGKAPGARDIVKDFAHLVDLIDLSQIDANSGAGGNQAFAFVGTGTLAGAAGRLRYVQATGVLEGDVNGDGLADFRLELASRPAITVADLVL